MKEKIKNMFLKIKGSGFATGVIATTAIVVVGIASTQLYDGNHKEMRDQDGGCAHCERMGYESQNKDGLAINEPMVELDDVVLDIGASAAKADSNLTVEEMLTYAIQDEYLAQAEYDYIIDTFGSIKPFSNIINAETNHIALLTPLLTKYATVPTNTAASVIPKPATVEEALARGVQAEIANIAMYDSFLAKELPDDVKTVFTELKAASENHLAAFSRNHGRR